MKSPMFAVILAILSFVFFPSLSFAKSDYKPNKGTISKIFGGDDEDRPVSKKKAKKGSSKKSKSKKSSKSRSRK